MPGTHGRGTIQQLALIIDGDEIRTPLDLSYLARPGEPSYQCTKGGLTQHGCGNIAPECCFPTRKRHPHNGCIVRNARECIICRQKRVDAEDRWLRKARLALGRHFRIERKAGQHNARNMQEYCQRIGITVPDLADEMRTAYERNDRCPGKCKRRFSEMPNGHRDLTIDRSNRSIPLSRSNHQLMCITCNSAFKGTLDQEVYDIRLAYWDICEPASAAA